MGIGLTVDVLEWVIFLSGIAAFGLAFWSLYTAIREGAALRRSGQNGALAALSLQHVTTASVRVFAGLLSMGGGFWLVLLPDDYSVSAVVAKHCWLLYSWVMSANLLFERWAIWRSTAPRSE